MKVIQEAADSLGFTVEDLSEGITNDFGFKCSSINNDTLQVSITNNSSLDFSFVVNELDIIEEVRTANYEIPNDLRKLDVSKDTSKVEELSAILISCSEVTSYVKEKLVS